MSTIVLISNLFPRPDEPRRGMFNLRFAEALGCVSSVVVPVMEWRVWRWGAIRKWQSPVGIPATYYPVFYLPRLGRNALGRACTRALRGALPALREADACLGTWLYPDCVAAASLAQAAGIPCWAKVHGTDRFHLDHPQRGAQIRRALSGCEGVMTNGEFLRDELTARGLDRRQLHVVRHGVDRQRFHHQPSVKPSDERRLLSVGNLKTIKGADRLYEAFAHVAVAAGYEDVVLSFVGSGPLRGRIEAAARAAGLADRVRFEGTLSPEGVAAAMHSAALLCLASRSEGMPNVVLEALACGTPIVSTDVGDVPLLVTAAHGEVVANGGSDVVVALAQAMRSVLNRQWDRAAMAPAAPVRDWGSCGDEARALILGTGDAL